MMERRCQMQVCQQMLKPFVSDMSQMKHIIRRIEDFRIM